MMYLMLRATLAGAMLFAGPVVAIAQSVPGATPPAQAAPAPDDQGGSVNTPPAPAAPAAPAPDDDSDD
jgi:hypothetical protein